MYHLKSLLQAQVHKKGSSRTHAYWHAMENWVVIVNTSHAHQKQPTKVQWVATTPRTHQKQPTKTQQVVTTPHTHQKHPTKTQLVVMINTSHTRQKQSTKTQQVVTYLTSHSSETSVSQHITHLSEITPKHSWRGQYTDRNWRQTDAWEPFTLRCIQRTRTTHTYRIQDIAG